MAEPARSGRWMTLWKGRKGFFSSKTFESKQKSQKPERIFLSIQEQIPFKLFRIVPIVFSTRCKPQSFTEPANGHCAIRVTPFSMQPQRTPCYRYPTEKHPRGHVCIVYLLCAQPDCVGRSRPWIGRVGARRIVFFSPPSRFPPIALWLPVGKKTEPDARKGGLSRSVNFRKPFGRRREIAC